jgi:tetratricopeptide (TPR) repeat protein
MSTELRAGSHAPDLRPLVERGDWTELIRFWLAHELYPPALEEAVRMLESQASSTPHPRARSLAELAEYAAALRDNPSQSWELPKGLLASCNAEECATLLLVALTPRVLLCHAAMQAHIAMRRDLFDIGLKAGEHALEVARGLGDAALEQLYDEYIAGALWQLDRPEEARDRLLAAINLARRLRQQEPQHFSRVLAGALNNLAILHAQLQHPEEACACHLEASEIWLSLAAQVDPAYMKDAAEALRSAGNLQYRQGDFAGAGRSFQRALAAYDTLARQDPAGWHAAIAQTHYDVGTAALRLKDYAAARSHLLEALAILGRSAGTDSGSLQDETARVLNALGVVQDAMGDGRSARQSLLEALHIRRRLAGLDPDRYNSDLAMTLENLARLQDELASGKADPDALLEAREIDREAMPSYRYPGSLPAWVGPARGYVARQDSECLKEAASLCEDEGIAAVLRHPGMILGVAPIELVQPILDRLHRQDRTAEYVMVACLAVGSELSKLRFRDMEPFVAARGIESGKLLEVALACEHIGFLECAARIYYELGKFHAQRAELQKAMMLLRRALDNHGQIPSPERERHDEIAAGALNSLGVVLCDLREFSQAESTLGRAVELRRRPSMPRAHLANALYNLGRVYFHTSRLPLARGALDESLSIYAEARARPDWVDTAPLAARCLNAISAVLHQMGDLDGAVHALSQVNAILREAYSGRRQLLKGLPFAAEANSYQPDLFSALLNQGALLREQKRFSEARDVLEECLQMYRQMTGQAREHIRHVYPRLLNVYAEALAGLGDTIRSLEAHEAAVREAESPADAADRFLYKGMVRSSYGALLERYVRGGDSARAFRCLAALRDKCVPVFSPADDGLFQASVEALRQRERELGRRVHIVVAETFGDGTALLAIMHPGQSELECFPVSSFSQVAHRLLNTILDSVFRQEITPRPDADYEEIDRLGREAWTLLPQPVRDTLIPRDGVDVLISGDPFWAAFPWEALRLELHGEADWLGRHQPLARWSPITASGLSGLGGERFGRGAKVAAVICPWDALPRRMLPSARREAALVAAILQGRDYHLIGGDVVAGRAATRAAVLHTISMEPSLFHFAGHGDIYGSEEVLMVSGGTPTESVPFGRAELLRYKEERHIAGRLFRQAPLFVLNSCFSGNVREFGGRREDLVATLIEEGAAAVVASPFPVDDKIGSLWGESLYDGLGAGENVLADVFLRCRKRVASECSRLGSRRWPLWMLWHLHGNPYARFA